LAKFRQNAKNKILKGIFCRRFFENLKKNRQKSRGFELVSPDLEALFLWVARFWKPFSCGSPNKSRNTKYFSTALPVLLS
jgi:hypothetical protein